MSLLQKASIITTPTAYAEDYLYSIKPAYALGSELLTNGDFNDGANNWIVLGSGASLPSSDVSNGVLTIGNAFGFTQNVAQYIGDFNPSERLQVVIKAKKGQSGSNLLLRLSTNQFGASVTTIATVPITTSYQVFTFTYKNNTANNFDWFSVREGNGNGTVLIEEISVKKITDADFDFDRNSTGTRVNEDYLIEDVPYNLVTYSEDLSGGSGWIIQPTVTVTNNVEIAPDGTLTADKIVSSGGTAGVYKSITNLDGVITRSVYLKSVTGNVSVIIKDPILTQTQKTLNLNETWQRYTLTEDNLSSSNSQGIWIDDIPASGIYMWGAQVVKGDQPKEYLKTTDRLDIPRIDYTNGEPSILLEPSRQNEVTYSQDFTQSYWSKNNVTVTSNQAISPEGIQNADKLIIDNGTVSINGGLYKSRSSTANQDVSFSVFAKAGEFRYGTIAYGSTNANGFHFDLEDGVILSTFTNTFNYTNIGYEMIAYPNGWYRLVVNTTELQQGVGRFIGIRPHNTIPTSTNNNYNSTGDGTSGILVYGAQIEVGSYATSLIHTSGSAVTRSADTANNAGNSDLFNDSEGVLYAELNFVNDTTSKLISINDNSASNRILFGNFSDGNFKVFSQSSDLIVVSALSGYNKIAAKYKSGDFSLFVNGTEVGTSTSTILPTGLSELSFDNGAGGSVFYGDCKMVAVFKEALSDTELEKLTGYNNHELYMNYYNRLSYLGLAEEYNVESDINNYIL